MKIPFSVYDFFGYLACGFFFLGAVEYAFDGNWLLLGKDLNKGQTLFWSMVTYIIGQVIAHFSSRLLEKQWLRGRLGNPEKTLWGVSDNVSSCWKKLFPDYYKAYSEAFKKALVAKATGKVDVTDHRELFRHCHASVKNQKTTGERLTIFLTQYGFARNMALAMFLSSGVLLLGAFYTEDAIGSKVCWAGTALFVGFVLLARYVKFYLIYTKEVFESY